MIPNGDLGKGFGLRASLELDKHPEGQRSEVVLPKLRIDDGLVLARVGCAFVNDFAAIGPVL
jgi:hypothetical protein